MTTEQRCPIWKTPARVSADANMALLVDSERACGAYRIGINLAVHLGTTTDIDDSARARLTTMLVDQRNIGDLWPQVTADMLNQAKNRRPLSVYERADRLLKYMAEKRSMGQRLYKIPEDSLAWSESINENEQAVILDYLIRNNRVSRDICIDESSPELAEYYCYQVTLEGYHYLETMDTSADSSRAFVAMWFDDEMNDARDYGIIPAIEEAGYSAFLVNAEHFSEKISDKIFAEIRRSKFLIADFSHKKRGTMRGSVYFEAGFASGLGKPVIYLCRRGSRLAFDTNHYPHIIWNQQGLNELRNLLKDRIRAIVGQGPLPPPS